MDYLTLELLTLVSMVNAGKPRAKDRGHISGKPRIFQDTLQGIDLHSGSTLRASQRLQGCL